MSKSIYSQYLIDQAQRVRLERERREREEEERRRREEARKQKIEQRRREEVKAEKERLSIVRHFQAAASSLQRKEVVVPKNMPTFASQEISVVMKEVLDNIEEQLQAFPPDWNRVVEPELARIKQAVLVLKKEGYDPFYYVRLPWLQRDLAKLFIAAPQKVEELYRQDKQARDKIDELVVELEMVRANAVLAEHSHSAARLISALEALAQEKNPEIVISQFAERSKEAWSLLNAFSQVQERAQMQRFVMENVRQVFEEMGYRAMEVGPDSGREGQELLSTLFRTPEQGTVQVVCGLDNSLHAEFVTVQGTEDSSLQQAQPDGDSLYKCEQWCKDYEFLIDELASHQISLREHWRVPPTQKGYREVMLPGRFFEEDEEVLPPLSPEERSKQV